MGQNLIEKYSDNPILRTLVSLIPNIGGALDILLTEKGAKWRAERLFKLLSELDCRIGNLEKEDGLNLKIKEELESEEFYDLLIQALNSVIRTRNTQKISCYANILFNHIINTESKQFSSELIIATIDNLTLYEIEYLSELFNSGNKITTYIVLGKEIHWEKYLSDIQKTGNIASQQDRLPKECLFAFDLSLIWKMLSDKNIVIIDKKEGFGNLSYTYGNSMMQRSSQITYTAKIEYKMSEFGYEFVKWILNK